MTPEILNSFIEKIYIGEPEKYDGRKMQEVEIIYKFVGAINLPQYGKLKRIKMVWGNEKRVGNKLPTRKIPHEQLTFGK